MLKQKMRTGVALVLLTLLAAPAAAADVDAALGLMPEDTAIVVGVNFDRFRKSSFFKDISKAMESSPGANGELEKLKDAGLDPRANLDAVFVAVPADLGASRGPLFVFPGQRKLAKVQALFLVDPGAKVTPAKHGGVDTLQLGVAPVPVVVAALEKHLVMGPEALVHAAIDAEKGGKKGGAKRDRVRQLLGKTDTGKDFWAVSVDGQLGTLFGRRTSPEAQKLTGGRASLDFASGLGLRLALDFADAAAAKTVAGRISAEVGQFAALPQLALTGLGGAVKKTNVASKDKEVTVALDLTNAELDQVKNIAMAMIPMLIGAPPPAIAAPPPAKAAPAPVQPAPAPVQPAPAPAKP